MSAEGSARPRMDDSAPLHGQDARAKAALRLLDGLERADGATPTASSATSV